MTYDQWKTTDPRDRWAGESGEGCAPAAGYREEIEAQFRDALEKYNRAIREGAAWNRVIVELQTRLSELDAAEGTSEIVLADYTGEAS